MKFKKILKDAQLTVWIYLNLTRAITYKSVNANTPLQINPSELIQSQEHAMHESYIPMLDHGA